MKKAKKIAQKVLILFLDILVFTWQLVRRVILPTRRRKGNVLSSLLTFFVGLLERIVSFEKSVLQRPVVFTHKYVKQGLIIAIGFLFLLSSLEWTIGAAPETGANGSPEVVACAQAGPSIRIATTRRMHISKTVPCGAADVDRSYIPSLSLAGPPLIGKRWLRLRTFRI